MWITQDPTDPEDWVHVWSMDAACGSYHGVELDAYAEPPTEIEKLQAKARIIRLDAEGNPVGDGEWLTVRDVKIFPTGTETVEEHLQKYLTQKTVTMELTNIQMDEEVKRLVFGEDYDRVANSTSDRRWYHDLRVVVRGLLAKVKALFRG